MPSSSSARPRAGWALRSICASCAAVKTARRRRSLHREKREGEFVRAMIAAGAISASHDVSDGGLLVAIAEMAMASNTGCTLEPPHNLAAHGWWFGEDQ